MKLNLTRPIIFFDLETTGTNITADRIVEFSYVKLRPGNGEPEQQTMRFNPGMPIPAQATAIHHITDADVADEPRFADKAADVVKIFAGCDIGGFNSNRFDLPLLIEECARAGVNFDISGRRFVDVQTIFHKMEKRTLSAAYKFYCGKNLDDAHSASADTMATVEVLMAQLDRYPELRNDIDFLAEFSSQNRNVDLSGRIIRDEKGREVFNFGKYKGKAVEEVLSHDSGYYGWMMKGDFATDTKQALEAIYMRMKLRNFSK